MKILLIVVLAVFSFAQYADAAVIVLKDCGRSIPLNSNFVEYLQTALKKDGVFKGKPNGKWDAYTMEAIRAFRAKHKLEELHPSELDNEFLRKAFGDEYQKIANRVPELC